jgi:hypothetical protein
VSLEDRWDEAREDWLEDERANEWWDREIAAQREALGVLRIIAGIEDPAVAAFREAHGLEPLRRSAHVDSPAAAAVLAEVSRLEALAEHYLDNADESYPLASGVYDPSEGWCRSGLEIAEALTDAAWRLLSAAMRRTQSFRALMPLRIAGGRIAALRARISRLLRPTAAALTKSHRPEAEAVGSLTRAAHAPPRTAEITATVQTAGGGPL